MKQIADRLFAWFCHPEYYPDIKGDLEELYDRHLEAGVRFPDLKYTLDVLLLFRISLIRPISVFENSIINTAMIYNYLKVSIRTLMRQKVYSAINIIGLAVGLAGFLLINEYVAFESSYDAFNEDADVLYRVSTVERGDGGVNVKDAMASYSVGELLQEKTPEVLSHTVSKRISDVIFRNGNVVFTEKKVISADSAFFDHFSFKLLKGNKDEVFSGPLQVVLSESKAKTYFGDQDPIGKTLEVLAPFKVSVTVTGIMQDIPINTHYHFDILLSDKTLVDMRDYKNWNWNNYYVYVKLHPETDMAELQEKADAAAMGVYGEDNTDFWEFTLAKNIYLQSDFTYEPQIQGSEKAVSFLAIISLFILLIAWINYINLSTAKAVDRAKEVGLRKVVGAFKFQLTAQFLFEALLINLMGAVFALVLSELLLDFFNQLVGKEILLHVWNNGPFLINLGLFVLLGTFVSGMYPALVLSGFKPIAVLKGKYANSKTGVKLRKGLVIAQFAASLVLIAATFTVQQQVNYMKGKDIGIDTEHVAMVSVPRSGAETREQYNAYLSKFNTMKEEMRSHSTILSLGGTNSMPGGESSDISSTTNKMGIPGLTEQLQSTTYLQLFDGDFVETLDMKILAGRDFDKDIASDSAAIMVNESFLRRLNIADMAAVVGQQLMMGEQGDADHYRIIGVVKDFNRTTLKTAVEPTVYLPGFNSRNLAIKLQGDKYKEALAHLEQTWNGYFPDSPFEFTFIDARFDALYDQDERFGNVFAVFSVFSILVATLGLFGLVSFLALQRTKEIGIRKVLGASIGQIVGIFYKDFIILLAISAVLGIPAIYFSMNAWLENYAFRISFPWLMTGASLLIVVVFALVTVGYQTYQVAIKDPSTTLRNE